MKRRVFVTGFAGLLAAPLAAGAQQAGKVYRIGCLSATSESTGAEFFEPFRQRLRELNYVEGRNITFDYRWADGRYERLATIPIVMRITADPVETGLTASLTHPGGNVTGVADFLSPGGKHLELLRQVLPQIKRVAVLQNPAGLGTASQLKEIKEFAWALGLQLNVVDAKTPDDLEPAIAAAARSGSGAITILADGLFRIHRRRIAELAIKSKLPAVYPRREFAEAGGFMSYGSGLREQYRLAADLLDKILRGAKPADLPVEQPTKFELVINLKTAKALGLTIPPSLLLRADQVIE